jgi:hypothetical protein
MIWRADGERRRAELHCRQIVVGGRGRKNKDTRELPNATDEALRIEQSAISTE